MKDQTELNNKGITINPDMTIGDLLNIEKSLRNFETKSNNAKSFLIKAEHNISNAIEEEKAFIKIGECLKK